MAAFNVSVHNSSPLISYTAAWLDTPVGDAFTANYTDSGFHTTSESGATATFQFNGTGVWFYGAHRPGYGSYTLSVDGSTVFNGSAAASNPVFDQVLGGSANLGMGEHTAVLTNIGGGNVDLDSLIFETQIGANDQQVSQMTIDDTNSTVSYLPSASEWQTANSSLFSNGTAHYSNTGGAEVTLTFNGDAVAVYGGVSFDHGVYAVSVDGQTQQLNGANGQARVYHPKSLLYFRDNLGNGTHNLTLSVGNGYFDLDQVVVYQATGGNEGSTDESSGGMEMKPNDLHINAANGNNAAGAAIQNKPLSPAVIAGIVAASVLGFVSVLVIIIFLVSQCRRRRALSKELQQSNETASPVLPIQDPDLEAGPAVYEEKKFADGALKRSTSRFTVKSFASRWSQASFAGLAAPRDLEAAPPVPALPVIPAAPRLAGLPTNPKLSLSVPGQEHKRTPSASSSSTGSTTLHSYGDGDSVLDDYYYRQSTASTNSVAPLRPARPPGLDLGDLGPSFDHVPL